MFFSALHTPQQQLYGTGKPSMETYFLNEEMDRKKAIWGPSFKINEHTLKPCLSSCLSNRDERGVLWQTRLSSALWGETKKRDNYFLFFSSASYCQRCWEGQLNAGSAGSMRVLRALMRLAPPARPVPLSGFLIYSFQVWPFPLHYFLLENLLFTFAFGALIFLQEGPGPCCHSGKSGDFGDYSQLGPAPHLTAPAWSGFLSLRSCVGWAVESGISSHQTPSWLAEMKVRTAESNLGR